MSQAINELRLAVEQNFSLAEQAESESNWADAKKYYQATSEIATRLAELGDESVRESMGVFAQQCASYAKICALQEEIEFYVGRGDKEEAEGDIDCAIRDYMAASDSGMTLAELCDGEDRVKVIEAAREYRTWSERLQCQQNINTYEQKAITAVEIHDLEGAKKYYKLATDYAIQFTEMFSGEQDKATINAHIANLKNIMEQNILDAELYDYITRAQTAVDTGEFATAQKYYLIASDTATKLASIADSETGANYLKVAEKCRELAVTVCDFEI